MNEATPQPRKILRAIVGVVLVVGMAVGYGAMSRQRVEKRSRAIESLQQAGGRVYLDYQWRDGAPDPQPTPPRDSLARRVLGDAWLDRVVAVDVTRVDDLERAVSALRWLPDLESLDARGTAMADQHIKSLRRVTNLRSLHLADTDVTDSSVQFLSNLRLLTQLDVQGTQITTTGVKRLRAGLPRCEIAY